jgi:DNA-binding transcriptional LysR family regulator
MDKARFADALTLDQLEIFVEVAATRSFTGAAKRLRRAQSAVSYGVGRLETLLGVRLFERSRSESRLTREGQILLAEARQVLERIDNFRAAGVAFGEKVEPELTLSVSPILAANVLASAARDFQDRFPHTLLRIFGGNLGATLEDVASGRATIGFTGLDVPPGFSVVTIGQVSMTRVVGPTHPLAKRRGVIPEADLRRHLQLVAMDTSDRTKNIQLNVLSPRTWRIADTLVRYQMVLSGVGWTHFAAEWVFEDLRTGRLVALPIAKNSRAPSYDVRAFHRADAPLGPAGRWLLERLSERSLGSPPALSSAAPADRRLRAYRPPRRARRPAGAP